jgi:GNAT superfamily N-acetyltransferase
MELEPRYFNSGRLEAVSALVYSKFTLRRGDYADIDLLVRHRRRMWEDIGGYAVDEMDEAQARYRKWIAPRLKSGTVIAFIVQKRDGEPVSSGCLWLQESHPRPGVPSRHVPRIISVYTEPEFRRMGHATSIVRTAVDWCKRHGFKRVSLNSSDFGRHIYERMGFKKTSEMWLDL